MSAGGATQASSRPPAELSGSDKTPHDESRASEAQDSDVKDTDSRQRQEEDEDESTASSPPLPQEPLPSNHPATASSQSKQQDPAKDLGREEGGEPPLPDEEPPPLPNELPPQANDSDDGWQPVWDAGANAYYFYNRFTQASQWINPRVPDGASRSDHDRIEQPQYAPGTEPAANKSTGTGAAGGYNPAIHGDYDPNADYAVLADAQEDTELGPPPGLGADEGYAATAAFNRFTGRFNNTALHPTHTPEQHSDEAKSRRQMNAFFDVDAAANAHGGRSLKAERQERKLSKKELQAFQAKRRARKEEKRRAWLRD